MEYTEYSTRVYILRRKVFLEYLVQSMEHSAWGIHQGRRISPRRLGAFRSELSESQPVTLARSQSTLMDHNKIGGIFAAAGCFPYEKFNGRLWTGEVFLFSLSILLHEVYSGCLFTATRSLVPPLIFTGSHTEQHRNSSKRASDSV